MPDVLVNASDSGWVEPVKAGYLSEAHLQQLLGEELYKTSRHSLAVCRGVRCGGPICDHFARQTN